MNNQEIIINNEETFVNTDEIFVNTEEIIMNNEETLVNNEEISMNNEECIICLHPIINDKYVTNCSHVYHHACIYEWSKKKKTCPLCISRIVIPNFNTNDPNNQQIQFIVTQQNDDSTIILIQDYDEINNNATQPVIVVRNKPKYKLIIFELIATINVAFYLRNKILFNLVLIATNISVSYKTNCHTKRFMSLYFKILFIVLSFLMDENLIYNINYNIFAIFPWIVISTIK